MEDRIQELEQRIAELEQKNTAMAQFVWMIANDYVELSHDKIRWQRDDYIKKARQLTKSLNTYTKDYDDDF